MDTRVANDASKDQIAKHLKLDRIEAKILDEGNKNLYFMYGKIKRKAAVGDTIELGMNSAVELCKCSKSSVAPILKKLEKLGFINCIQKGKQGRHSGRASLYRRKA
jgi:ribosomal protein S19E (S16A)